METIVGKYVENRKKPTFSHYFGKPPPLPSIPESGFSAVP